MELSMASSAVPAPHVDGSELMTEQENETTRRLQELEARIEQSRKALNQHGALDDQLRREWNEMLRQHAAIRRRLKSGEIKGSQAGATLSQDIDVLRHAFFRWAARVDDRFKPPRST
jgi:hypothetical protein